MVFKFPIGHRDLSQNLGRMGPPLYGSQPSPPFTVDSGVLHSSGFLGPHPSLSPQWVTIWSSVGFHTSGLPVGSQWRFPYLQPPPFSASPIRGDTRADAILIFHFPIFIQLPHQGRRRTYISLPSATQLNAAGC